MSWANARSGCRANSNPLNRAVGRLRITGMQRRILTLVAVAMLAIGLAACGSSSKSPSTSPASSSSGSDTITIQNFKFSAITVKPGATVTVKNMEQTPTTHTLTAVNGEFNTGDINQGESKTFTAPTKPGTYGFRCNIHTFMMGTLTVAS